MPGLNRAFFEWVSFCLRQGDGACAAIHAYRSLVVTSSVSIVDGACTACTVGSGHHTAYQPIAAAFAAQGGSDVLGVRYIVAGHAAAARNQKNIVGTHTRGGITCNHLNGTCSSTVAAHIGRGGNGDVAAPVDHRVGAVEGITSGDATRNCIVVHEIIGKRHAEVAACGTSGASVTNDHYTSAEAAIAAQAIGGSIIDGDGAGSGGGIARYRCTRRQGEAFGAVIQEGLVDNVFINAQQGFELRRFGGLVLFVGSFYLIVFLARHRQQADAKAKQ